MVPILLNPLSIGDRLMPKGMTTGDELRGEFPKLDRLQKEQTCLYRDRGHLLKFEEKKRP